MSALGYFRITEAVWGSTDFLQMKRNENEKETISAVLFSAGLECVLYVSACPVDGCVQLRPGASAGQLQLLPCVAIASSKREGETAFREQNICAVNCSKSGCLHSFTSVPLCGLSSKPDMLTYRYFCGAPMPRTAQTGLH